MDKEALNIQDLLARSLEQRGLARAPGSVLGFVHDGHVVEVTVEKGAYRGHFIAVHDGGPPRQFRAIAGGGYDWNAIVAYIREIAERRARSPASFATHVRLKRHNRALAEELSTITGAGPDSSLSIRPSPAAPGSVRVRLDETDLDPVSALQLNAVLARARKRRAG
jgi:hypothetical protein